MPAADSRNTRQWCCSKRLCRIVMTGTDVCDGKKSGCFDAGFVSGSLEKNSCYYLSAKLVFSWIVWAFFNFICQEINNLSPFLTAFWSIENMNLNSVWCFKIVFSIEVFICLSCRRKINNLLCAPKLLYWMFSEISLCGSRMEALLSKTFFFSCTVMLVCSNKEMLICWKDSSDKLLQLSCLPTVFHLALNS